MSRHAIKNDLFSHDQRRQKLDDLGDPLQALEAHVDFAALAAEVDRVAPRERNPLGGRPPYPTETIARSGQLLDATVVRVPIQRNSRQENEEIKQGKVPEDWSPAKRAQKDVDATWTKKHGKSYFGYKLSVNADNRHKVIQRIVTDTASRHDSQHFDELVDGSNTSRDIYADSAYAARERDDWLREHGYRHQIQRKGTAQKPLSECQQRRNRRIAKTRVRVEHVFASLTQMGGKFIRTIGMARAQFAMTMMAACYNAKRLVSLHKSRIAPF